MTANDNFFQQQKPAAVLKHSVLAEYTNVFTSMTGSAFGATVWVIDGYAGPGIYGDDGEGGPAVEGSPMVAMRKAQQWRDSPSPRDLRAVFIEADPDYAAELRANLAPFIDDGLTAVIKEGSVEDHLSDAWALVGEAPVVTFLDPFGVALPRDTMVDVLMRTDRKAPSEVLLNINAEAVRRLGGWLAEDNGEIVPAQDRFRSGVERVDRFFGDMSWRRLFYDARHEREGATASSAAEAVVKQYRQRVGQLTGCRSMSVPIRRTPNQPTLFHLTLFFRHPVAGYKFADAASRATRKWRQTYWDQYWDKHFDDTPSLFDDDEVAAMTRGEAERREKELASEWVRTIADNIRTLLANGGQIDVSQRIADILGDTLSFAGESHIKKAWDLLAADGIVEPRPTDKKLYKIAISAKR